MTRPRAVFLTGNSLRHKYVATQLARAVELVGIVVEEKRRAYTPDRMSTPDMEVIERHLASRAAAEKSAFSDASFPPEPERIEIESGGVNQPGVHSWVVARQPRVILLFGTGIVGTPLLSEFGGRVINMHLGLSPYYRGAGTNFWPLVNGHPECIGATIHLATPKVDAGGILAQARPTIFRNDGPHEIGCRAIQAGTRIFSAAAIAYLNGKIAPVPQEIDKNRAYRRADFDAAAVRKLSKNFEEGMIHLFLREQTSRISGVPIVELGSGPSELPADLPIPQSNE